MRTKSTIDPIVEEIHKIREVFATKFEYDIDAMFEDLRENQSKSILKIVSLAKDKEKLRAVKEKKVA